MKVPYIVTLDGNDGGCAVSHPEFPDDTLDFSGFGMLRGRGVPYGWADGGGGDTQTGSGHSYEDWEWDGVYFDWMNHP